MIPNGLISYSTGDLERMSRDLFRRRPDVPFEIPINMERLLQGANRGDIDLQYIDGMRAKHDTEGCIWRLFMSRRLLVCIDSSFLNESWADYNAVLAEELAHICLHPALFDMIESIEDSLELQRDAQWPRFEADAKRFSAMMRMPERLLFQRTAASYGRAVNDLGFRNSDIIEKQIVRELVQQFRVPQVDMLSRLSNCPSNISEAIRRSALAASLTLAPKREVAESENWPTGNMPPPATHP